jgi:hypothetical protein
MLFIGLILSSIFIGQTLHFVFESDDLRFLWWAKENLQTPWVAFYDAPLFGNYYRPIISIVWWFHYLIFGADDFCHQWMTGIWWFAAVGLLFQLSKQRLSPLAGFASILAFLCMYAGVNPIVWKSWLTTICSVTFQLASLLTLNMCLQRISFNRFLCWILFSGCAFLSKESAIICLPLTSITMIFFETNRTLKIRFLFIIFMLVMAACAFYSAPNLRFFLSYGSSQVSFQQTWLPLAGFFAGAIWTSWYLIFAGIVLILFAIIPHKCSLIAGIVLGLIGLIFGVLAYQQNIEIRECVSIGLMFLFQCLWFHPKWKRFAAPLVWLGVSYFPLPAIGLRSIPYAFDASVSLAWILGLLAYAPFIYALAYGFKRWKSCLVSILLILMLPLMLKSNLENMIGWKRYAESIYHGPERAARQAAAFDLASRAWEGPIYINVGERLGLETYLAVVLPDRFDVPVLLDAPPEHAHRLEAYSEKVYSIYPRLKAHDILLLSNHPPSNRVQDEPYFMPEQWEQISITPCNDSIGWSNSEKLWLSGFPIGNGAHLRRLFHNEDWTFNHHSEKTIVLDQEKWIVQFWLESNRWDWIESVQVKLILNKRQYLWNDAFPEPWNQTSGWRRFNLLSEAAKQESIENSSQLSLTIHLIPQNNMEGNPIEIGINDINLYMWKDGQK